MSESKIKESKYQRECNECGKEFKTNKRTRLYCSQQCQYKNWARIHRPNVTKKGDP